MEVLRAIFGWIGTGLRESLAMLWVTFWPLVLGFSVSGLVQSMASTNALRRQLGTTTPASLARASALGMVSSSCSYAASSMARAIFARGASWTNAIVFMVSSTNLVIELGLVMYFLLGWQFVLGQFVGGLLMIVALGILTSRFFSAKRQRGLHDEVLAETPPRDTSEPFRSRLRDMRYYREGARYARGDLRMLRRELLLGFVVAGFLSVHVPTSWWRHIFLSGTSWYDVLENVVVAPLVAVVSFVCSVGNIPLAAALWVHGVAFGGVIAFIFADLVTLPLLLIYRRFYGTNAALRLFALLWLVMSTSGFIVDILVRHAHLLPHTRHEPALHGDFALGWTLGLNVAAGIVLLGVWLLSRVSDDLGARDPMCGMQVDPETAAASRTRDGSTYYFCSNRCAERFDLERSTALPNPHDQAVDPVCGMRVARNRSARGRDSLTYYFCSPACESAFLRHEDSPSSAPPINLGTKPSHE